MREFVGGCLGRLFGLALIAAVLGLAWYNRHELSTLWDRLWDREPVVSEELAQSASAKLATLGRDGVTRVALHEAELQSLIKYRWTTALPDHVVSPRVGIGAGRVTMEAAVPVARLGRIAELDEIIAFLPDTTSLRAVASFVPLDGRHMVLEVHELGAAGVPIPKRLIPPILDRFRMHDVAGVGRNGLAVPLPPGIGNVYVSGDSLVLSARSGGV